MKKLFLIVIIGFLLSGCATVCKTDYLHEQILQLEKKLAQREKDIQKLLQQIQEKETRNKELRKRLETFGMFE